MHAADCLVHRLVASLLVPLALSVGCGHYQTRDYTGTPLEVALPHYAPDRYTVHFQVSESGEVHQNGNPIDPVTFVIPSDASDAEDVIVDFHGSGLRTDIHTANCPSARPRSYWHAWGRRVRFPIPSEGECSWDMKFPSPTGYIYNPYIKLTVVVKRQ